MNTCLVLTLLAASVALTAARTGRDPFDLCELDQLRCEAECKGVGYCDPITGICICNGNCRPQPGACLEECSSFGGGGYCDGETLNCVCDTRKRCSPGLPGACYMACSNAQRNFGSCHQDTNTCWCTLSDDPDQRG